MILQNPNDNAQSKQAETNVNMGGTERNVSLAGGVALVGLALLRRGWMGLGMGAVGAGLIYQGGTGISHLYNFIQKNRAVHNPSAAVSVPHEQGNHVSASITINRPIQEVYDFWRNFNNLSQFMSHLIAVDVHDETHSHWLIKGPGGTTIEWDAEIINAEPNSVISWRTLENPYVDHAGAVRFTSTPKNRGTEIRVEMEYLPIGGSIGVALVNLLGYSPQQAITDSLSRLKQLLEVGTVAKIKD